MPRNIATYRCLVISPSDVDAARDAVERVILNWNAHIGPGLDARIEPVRWESHARPEMGGAPQSIINTQIVDSCDFGIALFWTRLGSPTADHESGSAEEIERLLSKGARVMVYFCSQPIPQDAALNPQFAKLQELKQRYKDQGLLGSYSELSELTQIVNLHVTSLMSELLLRNGAGSQPIPATGTLTAPMPDIRVTTKVAFISDSYKTHFMLCVSTENHSPVKLFVQSVALETTTGKQLYFARDAVSGTHNAARELEPGNSFDFYIDAESHEFWSLVDKEAVVCAVATDKIGRHFRGDPEALDSALFSLRANYDKR